MKIKSYLFTIPFLKAEQLCRIYNYQPLFFQKLSILKTSFVSFGYTSAKNFTFQCYFFIPYYAKIKEKRKLHGCYRTLDLGADKKSPYLALEPEENPALIRMIRMVVEAAHKHNIPVSICGESEADLTLTRAFMEMGIDSLSVALNALLPLKKAIREISLA